MYVCMYDVCMYVCMSACVSVCVCVGGRRGKISKVDPNINNFINNLKQRENKKYIATNDDKLEAHYQKWGSFFG